MLFFGSREEAPAFFIQNQQRSIPWLAMMLFICISSPHSGTC
jgi:hypothetical protein